MSTFWWRWCHVVGWEPERFAANVRYTAWCKSMHLKINVSKTQEVMFGRENGVNNCKLYINDENLQQIDEFVFFFHKDGKMDEEILWHTNSDTAVDGVLWGMFAKGKNNGYA